MCVREREKEREREREMREKRERKERENEIKWGKGGTVGVRETEVGTGCVEAVGVGDPGGRRVGRVQGLHRAQGATTRASHGPQEPCARGGGGWGGGQRAATAQLLMGGGGTGRYV